MDVQKLLKKMTLREKLAQMTQLDSSFHNAQGSGELTGPLHAMQITEEDVAACGTVLGGIGAAFTRSIQEKHLAADRLKIPVLFMLDVIHGFRTIFPVPLAIGCTWDPALAEESARIAAREATASGVHVNFSPMVDLVRDARWGRVMESTGEDPLLNSLFSAAFVRGYQGDDLKAPEHMAACVKHVAAYGAAEAGRDYNTVEIGEYALREYYFPAYEAAVKAGVAMVMSSFNALNGVPSTANTWLLRDVLRKEWGFDGTVISDWGAVQELVAHGAAEDGREAALKAIRAGVDIEMMTSDYLQYGEELVREGLLDEALIDEAVLRILKLKDALGLFEDPYRGASPEAEQAVQGCPAHRSAAREIAAKSMVLLKNENQLLPLPATAKVAVIGPFGKEDNLLGGWGCVGRREETVTLGQALEEKLPGAQITYCRGTGYADDDELDLNGVKAAAEPADVIILALGEHQDMTGEATSRAFLTVPGRQGELAQAVFALGKPTVLVLFSGRPLEMRTLSERADAVLEAWFPGSEGGHAVVDLLFGDRLPEGRLTMSVPYTVGQVPVYYNGYRTGRPIDKEFSDQRYLSRYIDIPNAPLYPFGYGLGYSPVSYGDTAVEPAQDNEAWTVSAEIANEGRYPVRETVQLYTRDVSGSVVRPVRELKDFRKVELQPGERMTVRFALTKEQLAFAHADGSRYAEPGEFLAVIAPDAARGKAVSFRLR